MKEYDLIQVNISDGPDEKLIVPLNERAKEGWKAVDISEVVGAGDWITVLLERDKR